MKMTQVKQVRLLPKVGWGEPINDQPSMTEPNQVPKLVDVLKMAAMGKPLQGYEPKYADEDISEYDQLDRVERLARRDEILERIDELKEAHHRLTKLHDQKLHEEAEKAAYERIKSEEAQQKEQNTP